MTSSIGVIVPFDFECDHEYWRYAPDSVSLHFARTEYLEGPVTVDLVRRVGDLDDLRRTVGSLRAIRPDVVAFACTSASFVDGKAGEARLRDRMTSAGASKAVTTSGAILAALAQLGARDVVVATPYVPEVGKRLVTFLESAGLRVLGNIHMGATNGADIGNKSPEEIEVLAVDAMRPGAEALVLSCTGLRTFEVIPTLESRLGIPVLTANQVTMWAALKAARAPLPSVPQVLFQSYSAS